MSEIEMLAMGMFVMKMSSTEMVMIAMQTYETVVLALVWVAWWERVRASTAGEVEVEESLHVQDIPCLISTRGGSYALACSPGKGPGPQSKTAQTSLSYMT
jgi:hypothetical protein